MAVKWRRRDRKEERRQSGEIVEFLFLALELVNSNGCPVVKTFCLFYGHDKDGIR